MSQDVDIPETGRVRAESPFPDFQPNASGAALNGAVSPRTAAAGAGDRARPAIWILQARQAAVCFIVVFCVAYGSILLTRGDRAVSSFWPANAVFLVLAMRSPWTPAGWLDLLAAGSVASTIANCLGGTSLPLSILFTIANGAEVVTAFLIIRFGQATQAEQSRPAFRQLRHLLFAALIPPFLSAFIAGAALHFIADASFIDGALHWYLAASLGMLMILPLGVMDYRDALHRLRTPAGLRSALLTLGFVAGSAFLIFFQTVSPFVFLVTASILFATYHHRSLGAAASVIVVALIAVPLTASGRGPLSLVVAQDAMGRQLLLQAYLMAVGFVAVIATAILDDRDGLRLAAERRVEAARRKAEAQSQLLRHLAHEIRTPLNVIQGFATLLNERADLAPDIQKMTHAIAEASSEVQTLANGILENARVERGALRLAPAQHRVDDIFEELRAEFQSASARLAFDESSKCLVYGDRLRIKQMLRNLINNSVNYAGLFGPIHVTASSAAMEGYTRLEVVDRGPGIAKNRLHEVFEPFSKLGPDSSSGKSAGVGLSIVKQLAEAQHGSVGVLSTPYMETRFWILLPAAPSKELLDWYARGAPDIDPRAIFPH